jgi:two-component system CheB/CheR fusion protein
MPTPRWCCCTSRSTNDELQVINDQLHARSGELDTANEFLETILTSLRTAVVVLAGDLTVKVWNRQAQELWGLRREETVGEHFLDLDIGLPLDQLRPMIRRTLGGDLGPQEIAVPAVNRRGRTISVRIRPAHRLRRRRRRHPADGPRRGAHGREHPRQRRAGHQR